MQKADIVIATTGARGFDTPRRPCARARSPLALSNPDPEIEPAGRASARCRDRGGREGDQQPAGISGALQGRARRAGDALQRRDVAGGGRGDRRTCTRGRPGAGPARSRGCTRPWRRQSAGHRARSLTSAADSIWRTRSAETPYSAASSCSVASLLAIQRAGGCLAARIEARERRQAAAVRSSHSSCSMSPDRHREPAGTATGLALVVIVRRRVEGQVAGGKAAFPSP